MDYIELDIQVEEDFAEILVAELGDLHFSTFLETDNGIQAYCEMNLFEEATIKLLLEVYATKTDLSYSIKRIKKQNWNAEWESSFEPIRVADKIVVRAGFHPPQKDVEHEIVITPKMSFGTGHHDTTAQMMELQLGIDHATKRVLDVGTGTGILAVLAEKLGASYVRAFDIEEWSVENSIENSALNQCTNLDIGLGTIQDEKEASYDIVLANINRNILLNEIPIYTNFLVPEGFLLLSGFYEQDLAEIEVVCQKAGLKKNQQLCKNQWAAVVFQKIA